jgi:proline iminopeptidase
MPPSKPVVIAQGIAGALRIGATIVLAPFLRPRYSRWNATDLEITERMPGDEYVPESKSLLTIAVTVDAAPEKVWPWLAQLGCGRGGWYSYDLLDNGGVPSAERIIPEYQALAVGDTVAAVPGGSMSFPVSIVEPNRLLVLGGTLNTGTGQSVGPGDPLPDEYFGGSQIYRLLPTGNGKTRLIFRNRMTWNNSRMLNFVYRGMVEPITFNMGRKMLLNLKRRAEAMR